jgi:hypothetical protein
MGAVTKALEAILALRPWLRLWVPADITLLGWPGRRFQPAHWRHVLCYTQSVYLRDRRYAEARHLEWVKQGYQLTFRRNWRHRLYVHASKRSEREGSSAKP